MPLLTHSLVREFLDYLKFEKRYSYHTIRAYQDDLFQFLDYLELQYGKTELREIGHIMVRSWLASLMETGITARSVNRKISSLKSFFKYQVKKGLLAKSPMAQVISPRNGKKLPVFVKEEEIAASTRADWDTEDWKTLNTILIIRLFYQTGMRLSELVNLKENQVDGGNRMLKVLGKGNKERILPLGDALLLQIRSYADLKRQRFESCPEYLLVTEKGKKLYPKYVYLLVRKFLGENMDTLDQKSPHVLRHSFATHLMNNGADLNAVKELLGHSSLAATQVYTHNSIDKLKDVYRKAHPRS